MTHCDYKFPGLGVCWNVDQEDREDGGGGAGGLLSGGGGRGGPQEERHLTLSHITSPSTKYTILQVLTFPIFV